MPGLLYRQVFTRVFTSCPALQIRFAGRLREEDVQEWLANIRSAAPRHEAPLVELLCQVCPFPIR